MKNVNIRLLPEPATRAVRTLRILAGFKRPVFFDVSIGDRVEYSGVESPNCLLGVGRQACKRMRIPAKMLLALERLQLDPNPN